MFPLDLTIITGLIVGNHKLNLGPTNFSKYSTFLGNMDDLRIYKKKLD